MSDVFENLANHISRLGMGYPVRDDLVDILKEIFTEIEAEVALSIPNRVIPLQPCKMDDIGQGLDISREELGNILEGLADRGLIFSAKTEDGSTGYALQQIGFGFPQSFFWKGEKTPHAIKMAGLINKYFNRKVTAEAYSAGTKPYRYIPIEESLDKETQAVLPEHMMKPIIEQAEIIALAHCPCRVATKISGRGCDHPTDVCMKFNDMARYLLDRGLGKEINKEEAHEVIRRSNEAGLVHYVDNAEGEIQHNCNCCGCSCWNVGSLKRRKIPRDILMACYFIRETEAAECTACGECVDICPVAAVEIRDDTAVVDLEWCIGCGVCAGVCANDAISIKERPDKSSRLPASNHKDLHEIIMEEKAKNWD